MNEIYISMFLINEINITSLGGRTSENFVNFPKVGGKLRNEHQLPQILHDVGIISEGGQK